MIRGVGAGEPRRARRVQRLAQGLGVLRGDVEGVRGGAEGGDGLARRVDRGLVGDVYLVAPVVLVRDRVEVGEQFEQMAAVLAVVGRGEAGGAVGDGLHMRVGHDRREARVPGPDEPAQTAVGGDGRVREEVGEPLRAQTGDAVEGAGDPGGAQRGVGGRDDRTGLRPGYAPVLLAAGAGS